MGSVDKLRKPEGERKPFSIITASRLANEKHVDWLAKAVVKAKEMGIPVINEVEMAFLCIPKDKNIKILAITGSNGKTYKFWLEFLKRNRTNQVSQTKVHC